MKILFSLNSYHFCTISLPEISIHSGEVKLYFPKDEENK